MSYKTVYESIKNVVYLELLIGFLRQGIYWELVSGAECRPLTLLGMKLK